jgi:hypothetical protein
MAASIVPISPAIARMPKLRNAWLLAMMSDQYPTTVVKLHRVTAEPVSLTTLRTSRAGSFA